MLPRASLHSNGPLPHAPGEWSTAGEKRGTMSPGATVWVAVWLCWLPGATASSAWVAW